MSVEVVVVVGVAKGGRQRPLRREVVVTGASCEGRGRQW